MRLLPPQMRRRVPRKKPRKKRKERWTKRLKGGPSFTASPVHADGHLYFFDHKQGLGFVIKHGDTPELMATNRLDAGCMASPAVAGNALYIRTKTHLYRLESE